MLPHHLEGNTRVFKEISQIGEELKLLAPALKDTKVGPMSACFTPTTTTGRCSSRCSPTNFSTCASTSSSSTTRSTTATFPWILRGPTEDLSAYKIVFAPSLHLLAAGEADRLKLYVQNGGTLVGTFNTGLVNEHSIAPDTGYPNDLTDLFGLEVLEFDPLPPGEENHLTFKGAFPTSHMHPARLWCDIIEPKGCQVLATYAKDFYAGRPAMTMNTFGLGKAIYVGTMSHQHFYHDLVVWLRQMCGLQPLLKVPENVEVSMRQKEGMRIYLPAQPPELARPHPVLQTDARFPHGQHVLRQLRHSAARRAGAGRTHRSQTGGCARLSFCWLFPVNFTNAIPAALALLSLALVLWQWLAARRFPLHQRVADPSFAPAITLLKPLKGCDETTAGSLQSWFNQNYPGPAQILFGVADADDPVCKIVNELIRRNPGHDAQLVVCSESLGTNGKISTLIQLERLAKYELILIGDADVRVPADFLAGIVAPLRDDKTALVSCFYQMANPVTTAMRWEADCRQCRFLEPGVAGRHPQTARLCAGRGHPRAPPGAGRSGRLQCPGQLPRRRLPTGPSNRREWPSHRALPGRRRMLDRADELARRLAAPTPLGADNSRLPAPALFFQHPGQRHPLAVAVAGRFAGFDSDALRPAVGHRLFVDPNLPGSKSPAPVHPIICPGFAGLARAGEGFVAGGTLVWRVCGQHGRVARPTAENASRWDTG